VDVVGGRVRLRHLVVIIPGIGGSVLESPSGLPMWGQDRGQVVKAVMDPDILSVAESAELVPTDLLRSITVLPPFPFTIHGYGGLVGAIEREFDGVRVDIGGRDASTSRRMWCCSRTTSASGSRTPPTAFTPTSSGAFPP
jgi:hypothetical protein